VTTGGLWVLVVTELRARVRHVLGKPAKLLAVAAAVAVFGLVFPLLAADETLSVGRQLAAGSPPLGTLGSVGATVFLTGTYLDGASAIGQTRLGTVGPLVRTSLPPRTVVAARVFAEVTQATALLVPTGATLLALVGVGAWGLLVPLLVALAMAPLLLASLALGRFGGAVVRHVGRRIRVSPWVKVGVGALVMTVVFVATQVAVETWFGDASGTLPAVLPGRPLQAYVSLVVAPVGGTVTATGLAFAGALAAGTVAAALATVRLELALLVETDASDSVATVSRAAPRLFDWTRSTRVAWRYLLRTWRDPKRLAHLTPLLFGALSIVAGFVTEPDSVRTVGPGALVIMGGVLAGASYGLNPLGDERDQLQFLLTSTGSTAPLLRGRAIAGSAFGLLVGLGGVALALLDRPVVDGVALALFTVAFVAAGTGTALGFGALVPQFEQREYMNVERAHPSTLAVLGFGFGGLVVGGLGLVLLGWTLGDGPLGMHLVFLASYLVVVLGVALWGYVAAVRRFDALTLDDV
jgi:hypothetical protein